jgi:hypothetical protein
MRYMTFIKHTEDYFGKVPPQPLMDAMGEFIGGFIAQGKFIDGGGLMSTRRGKKVRLRNGAVSVTDGPFIESKEIIGGYALLELESDEEALEVARQFVELHRLHAPDMQMECELRPLQTGLPGSE